MDPSDLSDARWELIGPILAAWRTERRGKGLDIRRPPQHDLRRIMDAMLYRYGGVMHMLAALNLATGKIYCRIRQRKRRREFLGLLNTRRSRRPGK